jgi:delta-aminolevulinic acid dehydratase/porphobilinogen synthase
MPGVYKFSLDLLLREAESLHKKELRRSPFFQATLRSSKMRQDLLASVPQGLCQEHFPS